MKIFFIPFVPSNFDFLEIRKNYHTYYIIYREELLQLKNVSFLTTCYVCNLNKYTSRCIFRSINFNYNRRKSFEMAAKPITFARNFSRCS